MRFVLSSLALGLVAFGTAHAGEVKAKTTLTRGTILSPTDLESRGLSQAQKTEVMTALSGKELRRTVYAGYVIHASYVQEPHLIKRNTRVRMVYRMGPMELTTWGRALENGSANDVISLINIDSRKRVQGVIVEGGYVEVLP